MDNQQYIDLLKKYTEGKCNEEERVLIESWYLNIGTDADIPSYDEIEAAYDAVYKALPKQVVKVKSLFYVATVAASLLICLSAVAYIFFFRLAVKPALQTAVIVKNDFPPGNNKAILTLADGRHIVLTGTGRGKIATQGNVAINKTAEGRIIYSSEETTHSAQAIYNNMSTPRGGEYHLTLADGTNVWLNSSSSITYPTAFTGNNRTVQITGEVYFEVSPDKTKPFRVFTHGQTVEVLGTHFNINAYDDETAIRTTLFEGSVKISKGPGHAILKPGQQAYINNGSETVNVTEQFNAEQVIAWKNGKFYFDHSDIHNIMRQIGRWYDVDIVYEGKVPHKRLSGSFSKYMNASQAFSILDYAGVTFKVEGRKIIVK